MFTHFEDASDVLMHLGLLAHPAPALVERGRLDAVVRLEPLSTDGMRQRLARGGSALPYGSAFQT